MNQELIFEELAKLREDQRNQSVATAMLIKTLQLRIDTMEGIVEPEVIVEVEEPEQSGELPNKSPRFVHLVPDNRRVDHAEGRTRGLKSKLTPKTYAVIRALYKHGTFRSSINELEPVLLERFCNVACAKNAVKKDMVKGMVTPEMLVLGLTKEGSAVAIKEDMTDLAGIEWLEQMVSTHRKQASVQVELIQKHAYDKRDKADADTQRAARQEHLDKLRAKGLKPIQVWAGEDDDAEELVKFLMELIDITRAGFNAQKWDKYLRSLSLCIRHFKDPFEVAKKLKQLVPEGHLQAIFDSLDVVNPGADQPSSSSSSIPPGHDNKL